MYNSFGTNGLFYKHAMTFAPGKDIYSMHTHNIYELLYFVSGDATHVIEDRKYKLKPGDLILIRPFKYHYISIDSPMDYERYDVLFDASLLGIDNVSMFPDSTDIIHIEDGGIADGILRRIDSYSEHYAEKELCDILALSLKELFYCLGMMETTEAGVFSQVSPILSAALRYINDNLFTLQGIGEVAGSLFISESYLFRLFSKEMKKSPKSYISEKRLLAAQDMMLRGEKPTEVFGKCGFADYTAFYRNYKRHFGHPPSSEISKTGDK